MLSFDLLIILFGIFVIFHVCLSIYLLLKIRSLNPHIWKKLGSPEFFTLEGDPRSVFSIKVQKFIFFSEWPKEITDRKIIIFRHIIRITACVGIIVFFLLVIYGYINGVFVGD